MNATTVELHILQSFPPSCLNRDDTNTPKDCTFGGVRRARISSQCLKRATRLQPAFQKDAAVANGVRTKLVISERLVPALVGKGKEEAVATAVATAVVTATQAGVKEGKTNVLLFLGQDEVEKLVDITLAHWETLEPLAQKVAQENKDSSKAAKALETEAETIARNYRAGTKAVDIALFGRMVAEHANTNVDAAAQVAHAISTHRVQLEHDWFTAVDDLQSEDETGAGMMGTVEFNSACFYRYAVVHMKQLLENLEGDEALARQAVTGFLHASVQAIPTGKQNTFAALTPPSLVLVVVRSQGQPMSLANAFEKPVRAEREGGWMMPSVRQLADEWQDLQQMYGGEVAARPVLSKVGGESLGALADGQVSSLEELLDAVKGAL